MNIVKSAQFTLFLTPIRLNPQRKIEAHFILMKIIFIIRQNLQGMPSQIGSNVLKNGSEIYSHRPSKSQKSQITAMKIKKVKYAGKMLKASQNKD